jgi:hypothetical protein
MRIAKKWIKTCLYDHDYLSVLQNSSIIKGQFPRRLVDVKAFNSNSEPALDVRLIETGDIHVQYVTLSYCWGDAS